MKTLALPFFICQLVFINIVFVAKISLNKQVVLKIVVALLIFLLAITLLFKLGSPPTNSQKQSTQGSNHNILNLESHETFSIPLNEEQIREQIAIHTRMLKNQPSNRDILLNLAILHNALDQKNESKKYLEMANQLDPNNPIFK